MNADSAATLATACFAAIAAGSSWASVDQTRRERVVAATPDLRIEVVEDPITTSIHLQNHGGTAMRVRFGVAARNEFAFGFPAPTPTFPRGEGRIITTPIVTGGGYSRSRVSCRRNTAGTKLYVFWTDNRKQTVMTQSELEALGTDNVLLTRHVLPDFDPRAMSRVRYTTTERWVLSS